MKYVKRLWLLFIFVIGFVVSVPSFGFSQVNLWNIFVPGPFAPISPFVIKDDGVLSDVSLPVKPEVFQYLIDQEIGGFIAFQPQGTEEVQYLPATGGDYSTGVVTLQTDQPGTYVFVSQAFMNDFPIVTHWNQTLNNGRGGQQFGAVDELGFYNIDLTAQNYASELNIFDNDPVSPFTYNTSQYALFSGDPVNPDTPVPTYENYIGENYAIYAIRNELAVYISNLSVITSGYPLVHRNFPYAFDDSVTDPQKRIRSRFPAFQVAHAVEIAIEPDKPSLATVILPPGWQPDPAKKYPILLNGFYDIHENFAVVNGWNFVSVMGGLLDQGKFVGILWNGGGAKGTRSLNRSFYDNAALLFDLAELHLGADKHKIVTTGISRGGMTSLQIAANPYHDSYTVLYAVAVAPAVKFGDHVFDFSGNTYPGLYELLFNDEGYKYSWQNGWLDPITGLPSGQLVLYNLLGTTDQEVANSLGPISDLQIQALAAKGTGVKLIIGTNDGFMPVSLEIEYYNKLVANNIPVELNLIYRGGHNWGLEKEPILKELMQAVLANNPVTLGGTNLYRRVGNTNPNQLESFSPANKPFLLEAPELIVSGETMPMTILGGSGGAYQLQVHKISEEELLNGNFVVEFSRVIDSGWFDPQGSPLQSKTFQWEISPYDASSDTGYSEGLYLYSLFYTYDGGTTVSGVPYENIPKSQSHFEIPQLPGYNFQHAYFLIEGEERNEKSALEMVNDLMENGRGWGMSSDQTN